MNRRDFWMSIVNHNRHLLQTMPEFLKLDREFLVQEISEAEKKLDKYKSILSQEDYEEALSKIDTLLKIGDDKLTNEQLEELEILSELVEEYESKSRVDPAEEIASRGSRYLHQVRRVSTSGTRLVCRYRRCF